MTRVFVVAAVFSAALGFAGVPACAHSLRYAASVAPEVVTPSPSLPHIDLHGLTVFFSDPDLGASATRTAFVSRLRELIEQAGARMIEERDAASVARAPGDLVVRLERGSQIQGAGDALSQENPIAVRIYDAEGAATFVDGDGARIDTDARSPLIVADYEIIVTYAHMLEGGSGATYMQNQLELERQDGERKAELLAAQLFPDLAHAQAMRARNP